MCFVWAEHQGPLAPGKVSEPLEHICAPQCFGVGKPAFSCLKVRMECLLSFNTLAPCVGCFIFHMDFLFGRCMTLGLCFKWFPQDPSVLSIVIGNQNLLLVLAWGLERSQSRDVIGLGGWTLGVVFHRTGDCASQSNNRCPQ